MTPSRVAPVVIAAMLAASACRIDADYSGGMFSCTDECPDGLACVGGRCVSLSDGGDTGSDAADCTCEAVAFADSCGADVVDLGGAGSPGGQLVCASTEANTSTVLGCPGAPMPAADAIFRVSAAAGQTLTATVRPTGFDVAVYLTRDCSGACSAIADDVGVSGTETVSATTEAGDTFVVVDSPTGSGCYELTVTLE